jgi:hypothetical protein
MYLLHKNTTGCLTLTIAYQFSDTSNIQNHSDRQERLQTDTNNDWIIMPFLKSSD